MDARLFEQSLKEDINNVADDVSALNRARRDANVVDKGDLVKEAAIQKGNHRQQKN